MTGVGMAGLRTRDPLLPKQVRYQAALHPGGCCSLTWVSARSDRSFASAVS